ncbi:MAG: hypothetical protein HY343_02760 [Lentisphaerae bacterium]|nr:hypothetical protein [Lentisphaerota bacterium]
MLLPIQLFLFGVLLASLFELGYWFLDRFLLVLTEKLNLAIGYWVCVVVVGGAAVGSKFLLMNGPHCVVFLLPIILHLLAADSGPLFAMKPAARKQREDQP